MVLLGVELLYFRVADYFNIIDKPNERSSHTRITLRGGGIVFYGAGRGAGASPAGVGLFYC